MISKILLSLFLSSVIFYAGCKGYRKHLSTGQVYGLPQPHSYPTSSGLSGAGSSWNVNQASKSGYPYPTGSGTGYLYPSGGYPAGGYPSGGYPSGGRNSYPYPSTSTGSKPAYPASKGLSGSRIQPPIYDGSGRYGPNGYGSAPAGYVGSSYNPYSFDHTRK